MMEVYFDGIEKLGVLWHNIKISYSDPTVEECVFYA